MSFVRRSSRRLSDILHWALEPLRQWRKSSSRKSSDAISSDHQDGDSRNRDSLADSNPRTESTPPSSISTMDGGEHVYGKKMAYGCGVGIAEPEKILESSDVVEEPTCLIDGLHDLDPGESLLQTPKVVADSEGESRSRFEPETAQEIPDLPVGKNETFSFTAPRKRPLPTPPISPRSRSPAVPDRGCLSLPGAIRDSRIMAEHVQATREEFRLGIESYFWLWFADAKLLRKALDKLADSLNSLRLELDVLFVVSRTTLDEIELVDIHTGTVLQEGDRIVRVMTKAGSNLVPLTGRPRSMKKSMIKRDLRPQMAALAENLQILERRVKSITQTVVDERNSAKARRDILARAFSEKTLN